MTIHLCEFPASVLMFVHMTNQPPLSSIVKSHHLSFFVHLVRMDENADASHVTFEPALVLEMSIWPSTYYLDQDHPM